MVFYRYWLQWIKATHNRCLTLRAAFLSLLHGFSVNEAFRVACQLRSWFVLYAPGRKNKKLRDIKAHPNDIVNAKSHAREKASARKVKIPLKCQKNVFPTKFSVCRGLNVCVFKMKIRNDYSYHHSEPCCLGRGHNDFLRIWARYFWYAYST